MATSLCEHLIASDIQFDCDDLVQRGLEADGVIINRADIDFGSVVFSESNPNIIETLPLKSGKKGYAVHQLGNTPFTGAQSTLNVGTYRNTWTHEIPIAVLANTPAVARDIIDPLSNGQFVLVLKNRNHGADGSAKYQIYGYNQGLVASEGTEEKYSEDTDGGWLITLQEASAPKSAIFLFKTDEKASDALFESLKTAATSKA